MKTLQDWCVVEGGVISRLRKHNKALTNEQDHYKDTLRTLNKEVMELNEKLKEETRQREKEEEIKVTLEKKLMALLEQVETTRADTVTEFSLSLTLVPSTMVTGLRTV